MGIKRRLQALLLCYVPRNHGRKIKARSPDHCQHHEAPNKANKTNASLHHHIFQAFHARKFCGASNDPGPQGLPYASIRQRDPESLKEVLLMDRKGRDPDHSVVRKKSVEEIRESEALEKIQEKLHRIIERLKRHTSSRVAEARGGGSSSLSTEEVVMGPKFWENRVEGAIARLKSSDLYAAGAASAPAPTMLPPPMPSTRTHILAKRTV